MAMAQAFAYYSGRHRAAFGGTRFGAFTIGEAGAGSGWHAACFALRDVAADLHLHSSDGPS